MKAVGYLTKYPEGIAGERGPYYNYILARNGVFIEASGPLLSARIPVAECEIRGLAPLEPGITLTYGSIPVRFWELALDTFLAEPDRERYVAITGIAGYHLYVPPQDRKKAKVTYAVQDRVVLDLHSHGHGGAFFSVQDNEDEKGLKLYGVVGRLNATPVVLLRVGVYGYFYTLSWKDVFDGTLSGAAEYDEERETIPEVSEVDLRGHTGIPEPRPAHPDSWLRWHGWWGR
ncbi:MAG: Mov34/MPN/PAD-1 family protein [Dehalococcoidales bacterium]|nr:Mov34/MPN/PAD-1 family protein [Dehalococcoidales bacterium]